MDETRIEELVAGLAQRLTQDVNASLVLIEARIAHEALKAATILGASSNGEIDGANKEIRDQQTKHVLASSADIQESAAALAELEQRAAQAKVDVEVVRARVSLTKAALYSQGGRSITIN